MRVGFVLASTARAPIPSTRVAVLNVLALLAEQGVQTHILFGPETPSETPQLPQGLLDDIVSAKLDLVVFQKVRGPSVVHLIRRLRAAGIRTLYMVCDLVEPEMAELTDATVVVTEHLRSLYPHHLQHKLHVVHDGIEHPEYVRSDPTLPQSPRRERLRAVLVTSASLYTLPELGVPPHWLEIVIVGRYPPRSALKARLAQARWGFAARQGWSERLASVRFLLHPRLRTEAWDPRGVYQHLLQADVGIIPIDTSDVGSAQAPPSWQVKSENRLTLMMAAGLPVVATPIPSYQGVLQPDFNGFFAQGRLQWLEALERLRDAPTRRRMGEAARASVIDEFSLQAQARRLIKVVQSLEPPR